MYPDIVYSLRALEFDIKPESSNFDLLSMKMDNLLGGFISCFFSVSLFILVSCFIVISLTLFSFFSSWASNASDCFSFFTSFVLIVSLY